MPTTQSALDLALEHFKTRHAKNKGRKTDNSRLPAGSPMYYYCRYCSALTEVLPESHCSTPKNVCDPCKALVDQGIDLKMVAAS